MPASMLTARLKLSSTAMPFLLVKYSNTAMKTAETAATARGT